MVCTIYYNVIKIDPSAPPAVTDLLRPCLKLNAPGILFVRINYTVVLYELGV